MEKHVGSTGELLLVGDFNVHIESNTDSEAKHFQSIIECFGLQQHVSAPTHRDGGVLDLALTRCDEPLLKTVFVKDPCLSDHFAVHLILKIEKPAYGKREGKFRKIKKIATSDFSKVSGCEKNRKSWMEKFGEWKHVVTWANALLTVLPILSLFS